MKRKLFMICLVLVLVFTMVACKNLNRNFIGIELEENYFNIATQRIQSCDNRLF